MQYCSKQKAPQVSKEGFEYYQSNYDAFLGVVIFLGGAFVLGAATLALVDAFSAFGLADFSPSLSAAFLVAFFGFSSAPPSAFSSVHTGTFYNPQPCKQGD